jgi:hypothetical protein
MPAKVLSWFVLATVLAAAALWWWRDHPRVRAVLAALPVPSSSLSLTSKAPSSAVRKCVGAQQVLYTHEACPAGTREQGMGAGTVSVLPAAPRVPSPGAPAPEVAASAETPLRRLAGDGLPPDLQQRRVDQALQR